MSKKETQDTTYTDSPQDITSQCTHTPDEASQLKSQIELQNKLIEEKEKTIKEYENKLKEYTQLILKLHSEEKEHNKKIESIKNQNIDKQNQQSMNLLNNIKICKNSINNKDFDKAVSILENTIEKDLKSQGIQKEELFIGDLCSKYREDLYEIIGTQPQEGKENNTIINVISHAFVKESKTISPAKIIIVNND